MLSKGVMGGGAILMAVLIALTEAIASIPGWLQYVWAVIVLVWGIMAFSG